MRAQLLALLVTLAAVAAGCAGDEPPCATFEGMQFRQEYAQWSAEDARRGLEALGLPPGPSGDLVVESEPVDGRQARAAALDEGSVLEITLRRAPECLAPERVADRVAQVAPEAGAEAERLVAAWTEATGWAPEGAPSGSPLVEMPGA